jgi:ribosomal protein S12 methylthiotransferase
MPRKIHFVSLGCPKNRVDTEVMLGLALGEGYEHTSDAADAEIVVVNTCGFIGEAKRESIDTILELSELKKTGACKKLVVAGCLAQRYAPELAAQMPEVDHFLGSSDMLKLRVVLDANAKADRMLVGNPADWIASAADPRVVTQSRASAWLKIAEGCNRTCSFCVIPRIRGKQRSRTADDIVREAERLASSGIIELNLVAQDTIAYGRDLPKEQRSTLAELARRIADIKGVKWVRLFYLYPETLTDELVELIAHHPRVVPYVDMPLQHASDAMLERMKRGSTNARQRRIVEQMRKKIPGLTFRTAFIVGHPGETERDFEELCAFVTWARFERMGVFRYSDEETSASHEQDAKVKPLVAVNRARKLMALQRAIAREENRKLVGKEIEVLVEGPSEEHELVMQGRHAGQAPDIDGHVYLSEGEVHAGQMVRARVVQASDYDLLANVIEAVPKRRRVGLRVVS